MHGGELMAPGTTAKAGPAAVAPMGWQERAAKKARHAELAVLGAVLFAAAGHLLIKAGLGASSHVVQSGLVHRLLSYALHPAVVVGLGIYAVGTLMWVFAVSKREISYLFPLSALNYVLVAVGGKVLFREAISPGHWLGIMVVVFGVVLMQRDGRKASQ